MPYIPIEMSHSGIGLLATGSRFALRMARAFSRRIRERQAAAAELNTFSDYELKDIGVTRCEIDAWVRLPRDGSRRDSIRLAEGVHP